jgi:hypothetical protein
MNRLLTLATSGLFASGLAILPVSVFAQTAIPATTDVQPARNAPAKVVTRDGTAMSAKSAKATKDSARPAGTKVTATHPNATTAPVNGPAKTAGHSAS